MRISSTAISAFLATPLAFAAAQNQAPAYWKKSIDAQITHIYRDPNGLFLFTEAPCGIYLLNFSGNADPLLIYDCSQGNDVRITNFGVGVNPTSSTILSADWFILMIEQPSIGSGEEKQGRMARVSRTGGTEVWSKSLPVDLTWTDAVTPLVRKTCCSPPYITDNVYVNLYQLSPANAPMLAAFSVTDGSSVFNITADEYSNYQFGGMLPEFGSEGKFSKIIMGLDDYDPSRQADPLDATVLVYNANDGTLETTFTTASGSTGVRGGIPAPGFYYNDYYYFSDRRSGAIVLTQEFEPFAVHGTEESFLGHTMDYGTWLHGVRRVGSEIQPTAYSPFDNLNESWRSEEAASNGIIDNVLFDPNKNRLFYLSEDAWYALDPATGVPEARFVNNASEKNTAWTINFGNPTCGAPACSTTLYIASMVPGEASYVTAYDTNIQTQSPSQAPSVETLPPTVETFSPTVEGATPESSPSQAPSVEPVEGATPEPSAAPTSSAATTRVVVQVVISIAVVTVSVIGAAY
jgi:hypothetical protein